MIDLSIVVISWNMGPMLRELLHSIVQQTPNLRREMIIVDNHSTDGTSEMITREFPDALLVRNAVNRGVAPSRNQGLALARGRYLVILDADMRLVEPSLEYLVAFMDGHPRVGLCGCRLVSEAGVVQPSARRFPTPVSFLFRRLDFLPGVRKSATLRRHEMADWDRSDSRPVDYVIGACQIIRREAWEVVGRLDEEIFYGPEDVDYCLRMWHAGWEVHFLASTGIIHYEQRITRRKLFSALSWKHLKGVFYLFRKHGSRLDRTSRTPRSIRA